MAYSAFSGLNSGNSGIKQTVRQSNSFAIGDVVRMSGSLFVKAQANSAENAEVVGVIETCSSAQFTVVFAGEINLSDATVKPTEGEVYFLSASNAGELTVTAPGTSGTIKKTVYIGSNNNRAIIVNYLGLKNGLEGGDQVSLTGVSPVGQIIPFAGVITSSSQVPDGWLLCAGGLFNSTDYPELANLLGETYGPKSGTSYTLPDLRGRVPVGVNQNSEAMSLNSDIPEVRVIGDEAGEVEHTLSYNELPSHIHESTYTAYRDELGTDERRQNSLTPDVYYGPSVANPPNNGDVGSDGSSPSYAQIGNDGPIISNDWNRWEFGLDDHDYGYVAYANTVEPAGGGQPHNNMQPFLVTNWLIRANSKVAATILTVDIQGLADVDSTKSMTAQSGSVMVWGAANDLANPLNAKGGTDKFIINQVTDTDRNLLINGNFDIWQRGLQFNTATTGLSNYTADRWYHTQNANYAVTGNIIKGSVISSDTPFSIGKSNVPCKDTIAYRNNTSSVSQGVTDYNMLGQRIEGYNYARIWSAGHLTINFWVKALTTGTYSLALRNRVYSRHYVAEYSVNASNTWEWKSITIPVDSLNPTVWDFDNNIGLRLEWVISKCGQNNIAASTNTWSSGGAVCSPNQVNSVASVSGSGINFQLAQVQVEAGKVATPFQIRNIEDELTRCERYYEKSYDMNTVPGTSAYDGSIHSNDWVVTNTAHINASFRTRKRVKPVVTIYNPQSGSSGQVYMLHRESGTSAAWNVGSVSRSETNIHRIVRNSGSWQSGYKNKLNFHYTADAELRD